MGYIEDRFMCGDYLEIIRYPEGSLLSKGKKKLRGPTRNESTPQKKEENLKKCITNVKRLMHCNFKHLVDLFVTLTFKDKKNTDFDTAMRELKNFLKRLRDFRKKHKMPKLKYIWCMGKDKKDGIHFHIILNSIGLNELKSVWKSSKRAGRIQISELEFDNTTGLYETARYFVKDNALRVDDLKVKDKNDVETFTRKMYKRWSASKHLKKPKRPKGYPKVIKSKAIKEIPDDYKWYKTLDYKTIPLGVDESFGLYQHITLIKYSKMQN